MSATASPPISLGTFDTVVRAGLPTIDDVGNVTCGYTLFSGGGPGVGVQVGAVILSATQAQINAQPGANFRIKCLQQLVAQEGWPGMTVT